MGIIKDRLLWIDKYISNTQLETITNSRVCCIAVYLKLYNPHNHSCWLTGKHEANLYKPLPHEYS